MASGTSAERTPAPGVAINAKLVDNIFTLPRLRGEREARGSTAHVRRGQSRRSTHDETGHASVSASLRHWWSSAALLATASGSAAAAPVAGHFTGTLTDGATWIADVPANWNGTLLLYSHGYGPLVAADAPDPTTQAALLEHGLRDGWLVL